jgi:hypothetical protein
MRSVTEAHRGRVPALEGELDPVLAGDVVGHGSQAWVRQSVNPFREIWLTEENPEEF